MQLHGVSWGGCAARFLPQAHGARRACNVHFTGTFAFEIPSPPLSIKTQQTKNNSKDLKPQPQVDYLGGSLGLASDNTLSLWSCSIPLTSELDPRGNFARQNHLQREGTGSPAQVLGWYPVPSAAYLTCHHTSSGFHCLSLCAWLWKVCSFVISLAHLSLWLYFCVFVCVQLCLLCVRYDVTKMRTPRPCPWGDHSVDEQVGTANHFYSVWQRLHRAMYDDQGGSNGGGIWVKS